MSQLVTSKSPAELVAAYIKLRDKKDAATKEFKSSLELTNQVMEQLEGLLLQKLQELKVDSLTAKGVGTVYCKTEDNVSVEDKSAFRAWIESTGSWEALDLKANKIAARDLANAGTPIPGVKFSSIQSVGIRRA